MVAVEGFHNFAPNIFVLDKHPNYRTEVLRYLNLIKSTRSGQTLLRFLEGKDPKWVAIIPFKPTKDDPVNAYARPETPIHSRPLGYVPFYDLELPDGTMIKMPRPPGTGQGTSSYVEYHPATWTEKAKRAGYIAPGSGPAEVLYHELVHSYREMTGTLTRAKMAGLPDDTDLDEFYAILAANVYRSERGFTKLREGHAGYKALDAVEANEESYYEEYKTFIDSWFNLHRPFCMAMAQVHAKFNPFAVAAVALGLMPARTVPMSLPGG